MNCCFVRALPCLPTIPNNIPETPALIILTSLPCSSPQPYITPPSCQHPALPSVLWSVLLPALLTSPPQLRHTAACFALNQAARQSDLHADVLTAPFPFPFVLSCFHLGLPTDPLVPLSYFPCHPCPSLSSLRRLCAGRHWADARRMPVAPSQVATSSLQSLKRYIPSALVLPLASPSTVAVFPIV